jgi:hypothetical protein
MGADPYTYTYTVVTACSTDDHLLACVDEPVGGNELQTTRATFGGRKLIQVSFMLECVWVDIERVATDGTRWSPGHAQIQWTVI